MIKTELLTNYDAAEEQIIFYRKHLDIFIEDAFAPIKQTRQQHVMMRAIGNCEDVKFVCSRGFGKTWVAALAALGVGSLYPGSTILVVSSTATQATLVLQKLKQLANQNKNIANEITAGSSRSLVQISKDTARCTLKNGSVIESASLESCRGRRVKMVIVDEALDVNQDDLESIIAPTRNAKRDISYTYGFQDFKSKTVTITSACEKTNPFYNKFLGTVRNMAKGDRGSFACVLDYNAAVANGITDYDFFMKEKERMPEAVFDMEYGSKFLGANGNSAFPYELTQLCRTLKKVETEQPKNSKSRYFISLDIATSDAKDADNSIISVLKTNELADGSMPRKLVYMRSFHGKTLDILAEEVRKLCHISFPGTEKIIYDARGLGDSLDRFFDQPWVDTTTGKEYPPLVPDDMTNAPGNALRILHPFRAVQTQNQRLYTNMRVALEKRNIELPVNSRVIHAAEHEKENKDTKDNDPDKAQPIQYTMQQKAIFAEADALQLEMSNIVAKVGASGNVLYDTPRNSLHKDRYSSLAMGNDYISELEKSSLKRKSHGKACVGIATNF